ncbi:MAG: Rne/Rng family ribonuclease [Trueperella sp.]|nr:Rne/Rng family ribonuclease [Trueperella sp.]
MTTLLFQEPDTSQVRRSRRNRNEGKNEERADSVADSATGSAGDPESDRDATERNEAEEASPSARKRRRGTRGGRRADKNSSEDSAAVEDAAEAESAAKVEKSKPEKLDDSTEDDSSAEPKVRRRRRSRTSEAEDGVTAPKGSTRLAAKRARRREGRNTNRRRHTVSESEYLARRESVDRKMLVRERDGLNQIAVLEDGVLVEHYVARHTQVSMVGNVYLGRVQNVLPSMEAAFVDIGKGRNAVLYAGEVNWEAAGMNGKPRKIEDALHSGDPVLVQVTKDPIGHKGARLTGQVTLAGRHLVLVPDGSMIGISRKLPEKERTRLKQVLKKIVPPEHGVIVRTAAEGATEEQLTGDVERLCKSWKDISAKSKSSKNAPSLLKGEPELGVRVVRDIFNEDFAKLVIAGENSWDTISQYVEEVSPELADRLEHWESKKDIFQENRVDEQLAKAFDRKVYLPSGGSLVIDRTEAMTVIDVNTGKFTGSGGTLEETVTRNNLEAAEEVVRQLRLRDIGGIIVIDFIDMVLEANRELVLRRLIECLGRDRTRHQVAEVTSLGLIQMTRKRVGQGLVEAFSTVCECCDGRGYISHHDPVEKSDGKSQPNNPPRKKQPAPAAIVDDAKHEEVKAALANIAAAAAHAHDEAEGTAAVAEQVETTPAEKPKAAKKLKSAKKEKEKAVAANGKESRSRRRVTSSGTITPKSSASSAIMTFPKK